MSSDFEYIVKPKLKQRVAFGSTQERDISLLRPKFNRTSVLITPELFPNLSPVSYNLERRQHCQHRGNWSKAPRFKRITSEGPPPTLHPGHYLPTLYKKSEAPFYSSTARCISFCLSNSSPGPGTYNPRIQFFHYLKYYQNFGSNKIMINTPDDIEDLRRKCVVCRKSPTEGGEPFWKKVTQNKDLLTIMCCQCMKNLQKNAHADIKKESIINMYKFVCECPSYRQHAGMLSGRISSLHKENKRLPKEAFFNKFLHKTSEKEHDE